MLNARARRLYTRAHHCPKSKSPAEQMLRYLSVLLGQGMVAQLEVSRFTRPLDITIITG